MPGERNFRRSEFVLRTRMVLSPALSTGLKNYYFPYTNNKKCLFMWAALPPDDGMTVSFLRHPRGLVCDFGEEMPMRVRLCRRLSIGFDSPRFALNPNTVTRHPRGMASDFGERTPMFVGGTAAGTPCQSNATLVGWQAISVSERRCLGAALPPDDGTPQAAIEWVRFPSLFIPKKKTPDWGSFLWSR